MKCWYSNYQIYHKLLQLNAFLANIKVFKIIKHIFYTGISDIKGYISGKPLTKETGSLETRADGKPNTKEEQGEMGRLGKIVVANQPGRDRDKSLIS